MKTLGVALIVCGFLFWIVAGNRLNKRTIKRHGIYVREFPFAPYAIRFDKFSRKDWTQLALIFFISMILLNLGKFLTVG